MNAAARPSLEAQSRPVTGKKVARLRQEGRLPGVVFGHGVESQAVTVDAHDFELFRRHTGPNTLVDLVVDGGKATPIIVHGVQFHPVSRRALHVDLFAVRMSEELTVDVRIVTTGTTKLIDEENGTLSHLESVKVRALPDHLPQSIEVSLDQLHAFEDAVRAGDLPLPEGSHLVSDPGEVVVRVLPPRIEIEEVAAPSVEEGAPEGEAPASATETGEEGSAEAAAKE